METSVILFLAGACLSVGIVQFKSVKDNLEEAGSRTFYLERLTLPSYEHIYLSILTRYSAWADDFFLGARPISLLAFAVTLGATVTYAYWFFVLSWALGGTGKLGPSQFLPASTEPWERWATVIRLLFNVVILIWLKGYFKRGLSNKVVIEILSQRFDKLPNHAQLYFRAPFIAVIVFFVFYLTFMAITFHVFSLRENPFLATSFAIYSTLVCLSTAQIVCRPAKTALEKQLFLLGVIATSILFVIGMLAVVLLPAMVDEESLLHIAPLSIFFFCLPMASAPSDFLCWAMSRYLCRKLENPRGILTLVSQVTFNIITALLCMALTVMAITFMLDYVNAIYGRLGKDWAFDVRTLISRIESDPSSAETAWLPALLLPTLIPVMLHLLAAFTGIVTVVSPERLRKMVADRLTGNPPKARLDLPALYITVVPWVAGAILIGAILLFRDFLEGVGTEIVSRLLRLTAASHDLFSSLQPRVLGLITLIVFATLLWIAEKRA